MKPYRMHIFVCQGKHCVANGSEALLERLKERKKELGLKDIRISKSGCIKVCKETDPKAKLCPAVVVYPEGVWYRNITADDVDELIDRHVRKGEVVDRLLHYRMGG